MQSDGRPKKRCVHGSPSTGYQAPDSQIPARHRVPKGYAFLSVCAKPVRGLQQAWHGLSPNSIGPYRLGKTDTAFVCFWQRNGPLAMTAVRSLTGVNQTWFGLRN
jgi:hypothetical protein